MQYGYPLRAISRLHVQPFYTGLCPVVQSLELSEGNSLKNEIRDFYIILQEMHKVIIPGLVKGNKHLLFIGACHRSNLA